MRTGKFQFLLVVAAICSIGFTSCNKDNPLGGLIGTQVSQVQNSDVQDAVADKADQDVDKSMDELQANNYVATNLKSESVSGTRYINVDHPDSTTFPKVITIVYNNFQDSTANESFVKNGTIQIYITSEPADRQKVTRLFTFKSFSITTDSTTVTINGSRTAARLINTAKFTGLTGFRLNVKDQITANNLKFAIVKTGQTDSLKFTRTVARLRNSVLYYENVGGQTWKTAKFRNILVKDTIAISGTVSGVNENGNNYTKTINEATPLIVTFYKGTPVVTSGTMDLTISGLLTVSFSITYKDALPEHPYMTLVTVTNNATQRTYSFLRMFGRKLTKWW